MLKHLACSVVRAIVTDLNTLISEHCFFILTTKKQTNPYPKAPFNVNGWNCSSTILQPISGRGIVLLCAKLFLYGKYALHDRMR